MTKAQAIRGLVDLGYILVDRCKGKQVVKIASSSNPDSHIYGDAIDLFTELSTREKKARELADWAITYRRGVLEAEKILAAAAESFNWHPAYPMPEGYATLKHAQAYLNRGRLPVGEVTA